MNEQTSNISHDKDFIDLILQLWAKKKRIFVNCCISFVFAVIIAFSIPKEYTSTVTISPEISNPMGQMGGGLASIASMAGVNLGGLGANEDALFPEIYPEIVSSTPFLTELLEVKVQSKDGIIKTSYGDYLLNHQKKPWWDVVTSLPSKIIQKIKGEGGKANIESLLSKSASDLDLKEIKFLEEVDNSIKIEVDKVTGLIHIKATAQDTKIAATLADDIAKKIQRHIEKYRTAKTRKDFDFADKTCREAKEKYVKAQRLYASYADANQEVTLASFKSKVEMLENETQLAYNIYSQALAQRELYHTKVQERTPVCTVIQPATQPVKASSPKKIILAVVIVFLTFFATSIWIIGKKILLERIKA